MVVISINSTRYKDTIYTRRNRFERPQKQKRNNLKTTWAVESSDSLDFQLFKLREN